MRAASRMESVRDAVVREVGYAPPTITDVVVSNPIADANGMTLPLLGHPRIVLYTEPPAPETVIGEFSDWIDLLTVHETAHLIHLLRPSRNAMQRAFAHVLPLNPITTSAPRWVLEGYATVIEGRITGSGRPSSSIRAALLRKWAVNGRLPTYSQLNSGEEFGGNAMAYLAGSAFLEWLEASRGPDALRHLWARMTARQRRTFAASFEGVFGDSPQHLYGKFAAELTRNAVDVQRTLAVRDGELWQETKRGSGDPAISPDGSQLALVERGQHGDVKLVVYSTGPNEAEAKLAARVEKMLKRDSEDVAPVRTKPVPRKPVHTLKPADRGDITNPRWTRDGRSIIYAHKQPDRDGFLRSDLFLWTPSTRSKRRLTQLADVKDADPLPDARHAIAVRDRYGYSQLVTVDLTTGAVVEYTPPSLDRVYSHPRAAADGRLAWAENDGSGWHVGSVDGAYSPEWGSEGSLYNVVARGGFIDIERDGVPVTRSIGAAIQPAPAPDGSLYFMSLEPDGFVVRHMKAVSPAPPRSQSTESFVPALPPPATTRVTFRAAELAPPHPYGIGWQELSLLFGGTWTAYDDGGEIGVRLGDVVGRLDSLAIGATGPDRGAAVISTWRGWPVATTIHAFDIRERRGVEVRGDYRFQAPRYVATIEAGANAGTFAIASLALRQRDSAQAVRIAANSHRHFRLSAAGSANLGGARIALRAETGRRLSIGGFAASVVPDSMRIERVDDPALPRAFAFAEHYRAARAELAFGSATFFWQRYRAGSDVDVRGIEFRASNPPGPLLRAAAVDVTAGAARVTNQRGIKAWLALRWRP